MKPLINFISDWICTAVSDFVHEFKMKHLLFKFDPAIHGEVAPPEWHSDPVQRQVPPRRTDGFRLVASTRDGATAFSTNWQQAGARTLEAPVRSGGAHAGQERSPNLTRADLIELAKRNVSQHSASSIKAIWANNPGMSAAQIAKVAGFSQRTIERAIGAFNASLRQ